MSFPPAAAPFLAFARLLRRFGFTIAPEQASSFMQAVTLLGPRSMNDLFEAAQLVRRHHFEGGTAVFELNEGEHHDHIICMDCGRVEEFVDCGIERRQDDVATRLGFAIEEHNLILYGRCRRENCAHRRQRS